MRQIRRKHNDMNDDDIDDETHHSPSSPFRTCYTCLHRLLQSVPSDDTTTTTTNNERLRRFCVSCILSSFVWYLFYLAVRFPSSDPMVGVTIPLLASSSVCYLLLLRPPRPKTTNSTNDENGTPPEAKEGGGEPSYATTLTLLLTILPPVLHLTSLLLHDTSLHLALPTLFTEKCHHLWNDFGKISISSMGWFLIPVSRHSILLKSLGWNFVRGASIHSAAGYVSLLSGILHSIGWIMIFRNDYDVGTGRWVDTLIDRIVPQEECWSLGYLFGTGEEFYCGEGKGPDCCYRKFRNLAGVVSIANFVLLASTSMWYVRRNYYGVFYVCHVMFGSFLCLGLLMHWNVMVWHLSPSILYYFASWGPTVAQHYVIPFFGGDGGGVKLTEVTHVHDSGGCVELSFRVDNEAGEVLESIPSQYVKINVKEVSSLWHPFTVFTKDIDGEGVDINDDYDNNDNDGNGVGRTMTILFRTHGKFTHALADRLQTLPYPTIKIDGFYSGTDYLDKALHHHDTVVMMAGGIGITPYISMMRSLVDMLRSDGGGGSFCTRRVVLHWFCRDEGLIQHVERHYFEPLIGTYDNDVERPSEDGDGPGIDTKVNERFHIVIHHTTTNGEPTSFSDLDEEDPRSSGRNDDDADMKGGNTFTLPVVYSSGFRKTIRQNLPSFLVFSTISFGGLLLVKYCYDHLHSKRAAIGNRIVSTLLVIISSIVVPLVGSGFVYCASSLRTYWRYRYETVTRAENDESTRRTNGAVELMGPRDTVDPNETLEEVPRTRTGRTTDVEVKHSKGRPRMEDIIRTLSEDSTKPGFFMCGPNFMKDSIHGSVEKYYGSGRCSVRTKPQYAFYEEAFET